jgi:hypothetical protein
MIKILIIILILIPLNLFAQSNDSLISPMKNKSKFSFAFSPTLYLPLDGNKQQHYSIGYGLTFNTSYKITDEVNISGNVGMIFSNFEGSSFTQMFFKKPAVLLKVEAGPKLYVNERGVRGFINPQFGFIYFIQNRYEYSSIKDIKTALGLSLGFGLEIPIIQEIGLEINNGFNYYYQNDFNHDLKTIAYFNINIGARYNY